MMESIDSARVRQKLEAQRAEVLGEIQELEEPQSGRDVFNPDRSDLAQTFTSMERMKAMLERKREQLAQIDSALQRLEQGTYGKCIRCGKAINPERLELLPYAAKCIECQSK